MTSDVRAWTTPGNTRPSSLRPTEPAISAIRAPTNGGADRSRTCSGRVLADRVIHFASSRCRSGEHRDEVHRRPAWSWSRCRPRDRGTGGCAVAHTRRQDSVVVYRVLMKVARRPLMIIIDMLMTMSTNAMVPTMMFPSLVVPRTPRTFPRRPVHRDTRGMRARHVPLRWFTLSRPDREAASGAALTSVVQLSSQTRR